MGVINARRALDLVMRLMHIPGISGQEAKIADEIRRCLCEWGIPASSISHDSAHRRTPLAGEVGNLIVRLPGDRKRPRIMLSAHMDTVPICQGSRPKRNGQMIESANRSTGLGADDRAGVAVVLTAMQAAIEQQISLPPITLCFFIQEEIGLQGSRHLSVNRLGKPQVAFNFDGGSPLKMTVGATSGERIRICLRGIPAHAGLAPQDGASAIHAAGLAIADLQRSGWLGQVRKGRRRGTSNIGVIQGGNATNVVCETCELQAEARSHDGEFRQEIVNRICEAFEKAANQTVSSAGHSVIAEISRRVDYEAFRLPDDSPAIVLLEKAMEALHLQPTRSVTDGGVDANWLVKHGIPTVTLGCGQRNVHTDKEKLHIEDYILACRIALKVIENAT
ncbi:MAG: M20/M25/M40 family metallo-hydrolase [Planctomycetales bacterium]|nr:M20/M25/M40 family metallo-hydrolase [Planctomycetales bacterium]